MTKSVCPDGWLFEFDFESDPDRTPDAVIMAVRDQLSQSKTGEITGNIVTVGDVCEAFALKMSLGHHIVRAERRYALGYTG